MFHICTGHQFLFVVLVAGGAVTVTAEKFYLGSNAPGILGSPITFHAQLVDPYNTFGVVDYTIAWQENYPNSRTLRATLDPSNNYTSNWTVVYTGTPGTFSITVVVDYTFAFIHIPVVNRIYQYNVTSNFTGEIQISQPGAPSTQIKPEDSYVSTKNETLIQLKLHDPTNYLSRAINVTYDWKINGQVIPNATHLSNLTHNFTVDGIYPVEVNLTTLYNETNTVTSSNGTGLVYRNSTFRTNVVAKVPIVNFTISGQTWFRHGRLLDIRLECDGSPPYTYCWQIRTGPYNVTGNETCSSPSVTNECEIPITRYIGSSGIYTLLVIMENDISRFTNRTVINVYKVTRRQQLSIIVVPLSCSLLAVVLIIFGVAYYWESRVRYSVEVADFDFGQAETIPYMSFMDRLRDSISNSFLSQSSRYRRRSQVLLIPDNTSSVIGGGGGMSGGGDD